VTNIDAELTARDLTMRDVGVLVKQAKAKREDAQRFVERYTCAPVTAWIRETRKDGWA